ncbi:hypothetical protein HMPREF1550_02444 [Actinomyces sp. oral taxon 877 str. F0543]|nr:hypothetical protein HMPREF1550_02444 [Actinomyces sp. oral taxon 877 str. F0543]
MSFRLQLCLLLGQRLLMIRLLIQCGMPQMARDPHLNLPQPNDR